MNKKSNTIATLVSLVALVALAAIIVALAAYVHKDDATETAKTETETPAPVKESNIIEKKYMGVDVLMPDTWREIKYQGEDYILTDAGTLCFRSANVGGKDTLNKLIGEWREDPEFLYEAIDNRFDGMGYTAIFSDGRAQSIFSTDGFTLISIYVSNTAEVNMDDYNNVIVMQVWIEGSTYGKGGEN